MKKEVKQEILKDPRFAHVLRDPRFKPLRKEQVKVKIDKRFQSMFHDKKFQVKSEIDKRGRPIPLNSSENLKRFYEFSGSESEDESSEEEEEEAEEGESGSDVEDDNEKSEKKEKEEGDEEESSSDEDSDDEEKSGDEDQDKSDSDSEEEKKKLDLKKGDEKYLTPEVKEKLQNLSVDYARGQDCLYSDSSSDEESSDEEDQELAHDWGELDKDAEHTEEATSRIAICNMNWDRAKAVDLMVLFHSFLPAGGMIHSITVYPSEYGLEKMKEEEEMGPSELREITGEDEDGKINREAMEKLRIYQLNRLRYFYAVAVCDSAETANALYKACDGLEYETSSNKLDLRFIPEDMTFDQEPRETCTSLPDLSTYKPRLFQTKALTHSKAELTWDETDPDRQDVVKLAHSGVIKEDQLKMYLASSSESEDELEAEPEAKDDENSKDEDESEKGSLDKYKALLAEIESKEKKNSKNKIDLEVTWNLGLEKKANELVKEKLKGKGSLTPFEQFLEKRKEKRKQRREEKKKKREDKEEPESGDSAFSDDDIPSDIDMNDPYFKEEMEQFKKKKKKTKKVEKEEDEEEDEEEKTKKAQLELLLLDGDERGDKHFNFKKIAEEEKDKKKKKKKMKKNKEEEKKKPIDNFQVDVNDERFSAVFSSHHFNIDPADSNFKMTQGTKALIEEKLKRRGQSDPVPEESAPKVQKTNEKEKKRKAELSVLVKTIKRKTSEAQRKRNN